MRTCAAKVEGAAPRAHRRERATSISGSAYRQCSASAVPAPAGRARGFDGDRIDPRVLPGVGAALVLGFCCATVAALYPDLSSIWTARPDRAVRLIADHPRGRVGVRELDVRRRRRRHPRRIAVLARVLDRASPGSALPAVATAFAVAGSAVWIANLAYRLTVTVRVADAVHHIVAVPDWYADVTGGLMTGGSAPPGCCSASLCWRSGEHRGVACPEPLDRLVRRRRRLVLDRPIRRLPQRGARPHLSGAVAGRCGRADTRTPARGGISVSFDQRQH